MAIKGNISKRGVDVILWGATGFTGQLVAEYFARSAPPSLKFALAGRSLEKLEKVKKNLVLIDPKYESLQLFSGADSLTAKQELMDDIVSQTSVILSTAGPFTKYGTPLVDACVRNGTHYCDITGESTWVRTLIDKYHEEAKEKEILIVPMCGFDSIPFDLGVYSLANYFKEKGGVKWIKGYYEGNARPSGGTIHTVLHMISTTSLSELSDPHCLSPPSYRNKKIPNGGKDQVFIRFDKTVNRWTIPFVMSGVNTRVVRRSQYLLEDEKSAYGPSNDFFYSETELQKSFLVALITTIFMSIFMVSIYFAFTRKLIAKIVPQPGEGPSPARRARSYFKVHFIGEGVNGEMKKLVVSGGDPGYTETAKMISESAITLALFRDKLPSEGGVLTSASALGNVLVDRLHKAGLTFVFSDHIGVDKV